jgi:hypothetical protein
MYPGETVMLVMLLFMNSPFAVFTVEYDPELNVPDLPPKFSSS